MATKITAENRAYLIKQYEKACSTAARIEKKFSKASYSEIEDIVKEYSIVCAKKHSLQNRISNLDNAITASVETITTNFDGHGSKL